MNKPSGSSSVGMGKRGLRTRDPRQLQFLSLLDQVDLIAVPDEPKRTAASHDLDQKLRGWLNEAIDAAPINREQIADAMTALCGRQVTKPMIDTWTGAARPNRFPADLLPAFCLAVGNLHVMERLAADCGARLSDTQEAKLARIGQWSLLVAYGLERQRTIAATLPPLPLLKGSVQ